MNNLKQFLVSTRLACLDDLPVASKYYEREIMRNLIYLLILGLCSGQSFAADQSRTKNKVNVAEQTKSNTTKVKVEEVTTKTTEPTVASQRAFDRAMLLIRAGDMEAAHKELTYAIEKSPNYATAYSNRGLVNSHLGNKTRALDDFNKAIAIEPNNSLWRYQLAAHYSLNNQVDIGLDTLEKALSLGFAKSDNTQINALKLSDAGDPDLDNLKKRKKEYCNLLERHGKFLCS